MSKSKIRNVVRWYLFARNKGTGDDYQQVGFFPDEDEYGVMRLLDAFDPSHTAMIHRAGAEDIKVECDKNFSDWDYKVKVYNFDTGELRDVEKTDHLIGGEA